ncbi:MAG: hypothetical protein RIF33_00875 [Cyclobacteriaceae bacterium]
MLRSFEILEAKRLATVRKPTGSEQYFGSGLDATAASGLKRVS